MELKFMLEFLRIINKAHTSCLSLIHESVNVETIPQKLADKVANNPDATDLFKSGLEYGAFLMLQECAETIGKESNS